MATRMARSNPVVLVPHEGAVHPIFDKIDKRDAVQALLMFERPVSTARAQDEIRKRVQTWIDATDWRGAGGRPSLGPIELSGHSGDVTFVGVLRPRHAIEGLIAELGRSKQQLREVVLLRRPMRR